MSKFLKWWLTAYLFLPLLALNSLSGENHHLYLAYSFLKGSLSLIPIPTITNDLSFYSEKFYLPFAPLTAILLVPFAWIFNLNFQEGYLNFPLTCFNFWLVFQIAKNLNLPPKKAILLAIFYIFGSIYLPLAAIHFSAYLPQVVATTFLLLAIHQFLKKRRYLLVGISLALATLARPTLSLASIFFLLYFYKSKKSPTTLAKIIIPVFASTLILASYNFVRFDDIMENGYSHQIVPEQSAKRREYGLFSVKHIPANLYYQFLSTPQPILADDSHVFKPPYFKPEYYGMSLFLISPVLILLFKSNFKDSKIKFAFITTLVMLVPIVTYYGIGWRQIGYRYALDFMPFLLIPLADAFKKVDTLKIALLVIMGIITTWFFTIEMILGF